MSQLSGARIVDQVLADYARLEPGQGDTWNPLVLDFELFHRLSLAHALTHALRLSRVPISELQVLDLGCGNGRSTRMYLDLGLMPGQLYGLDLRHEAIELAKKLHPSIRFETYDGTDGPFANQSFTWIHMSTVVSSIRQHKHRLELACQAARMLGPEGCIFYFDSVRANDFAGSDIIHPEQLFAEFKVLARREYHVWRTMQEFDSTNLNPLYLNYCRIKTSFFPLNPTHEALLFQMPG